MIPMSRSWIRKVAAAIPFSVACGIVVASDDAGEHLRPFGWFAELIGSCWTGDYPDGRTSDTQCYSSQYGRVLRGTIELQGVHNGRAVASFEGDSVYAWNPKAKRIDYTFWANDGTYGTARAYLEGEAIVHISDRPPDSKAPEIRSVWRRIDADTFEVTREKKSADSWERVFSVRYRRVDK
jgi:hypothetical protein